MSSWVNRNIPRKRNLDQIPIEFRPTIVSRAERSEVIQSELVQQYAAESKTKNEIIYPSEMSAIPERPYYVTQRVERSAPINATELRLNDQSYVFVILRHIGTPRDNELWITSYNAIRKFYNNKIVIIDDNSSINTVNGKLQNTEIITSEFNGAGEILPYYYFLQNHWADRMIFLHDSMFLQRPFRPEELEGSIRFHWYFEQTEYDDDRKIANYLSFLNHADDLKSYAEEPLWKGCFGCTSVISFDIVQSLEEKYGIFSKLVYHIRVRKDRQSFERLFGLIAFFEGLVTEETCSTFGDIMKYPGAFQSIIQSQGDVSYALTRESYDTAIGKVWRGR